MCSRRHSSRYHIDELPRLRKNELLDHADHVVLSTQALPRTNIVFLRHSRARKHAKMIKQVVAELNDAPRLRSLRLHIYFAMDKRALKAAYAALEGLKCTAKIEVFAVEEELIGNLQALLRKIGGQVLLCALPSPMQHADSAQCRKKWSALLF